MCLNPKWIYKKGNYKEDNYRGMAGDFYELGTYSKCGSCVQCINEKCNNWVVRNFYEEKAHTKKCFITLTYAENPIILIRKDAQDFMKRLRRKLEYKGYKNKIRMYGCGEYGTLNNRPHLHFIIYGWNDENPIYLDINKKTNIVYQSKLIQEVWGKGRTSYQDFTNREIPYITLYETPQEVFKRAYKLNFSKLKKLEDYAKSKYLDKKTKLNLINEITTLRKELEESKKEYILSKEFNCWSLALGWEEFEKEYYKSNNNAFKEYIEDKEFVTPSPWVKKLANMGDIPAKEEMLRREEEIKQSATEEEEATKNRLLIESRKKKEIEEWQDKKNKIELL